MFNTYTYIFPYLFHFPFFIELILYYPIIQKIISLFKQLKFQDYFSQSQYQLFPLYKIRNTLP